ncbi:YsnF/AvaK domain-containing protein [Massilia horti]|uniref:DUF2382 domain-containing protein n=1 Tax=Massilia horti TaxID=2562153 RepID=A0A4Y9T8F2_9BURK|nr:YsnF/AvaK domain-containing protein [Massilia horti]TFW35364.1 DUF2382 domain-containing protein [Massilia horti]
MAGTPGDPGDTRTATVPVVEEQLSVGTRTVETGGGVRIHKTVSEHPAAFDQSVSRDEVVVRHVPVDRLVAPGEAPVTRYEGETLVVPVLEEELVVERRVRIKEELHITRVRHPERRQGTVILRSEQVSVERLDEDTPPAK